jgi:hypothetical protein
MANEAQQARAFLAAQKAREAQRAAVTPPTSEAEQQANADITRDVSLPGPVGVVQGMLQPGNVIRAVGEAGGAAIGSATPAGPVVGSQVGGLAIQPLATAAQRKFNEFIGKPNEGSYLGDLAYDTVTNEVANRVVSPAMGWAAGKIGSSALVQAGRKKIATKLMDTITPDARDALRISEDVIGDLHDTINNFRQAGGKPLLSRDDVEQRIGEFLPILKNKGMFTVGDLTTGTPVDVIEGVSEGSLRGRGRFGKKRQAAEAAMEAWPKVFAAALGDEAQGPDQLAEMAARSIQRGVNTTIRSAGRKVGNVEKMVRNAPVEIDEGILAPIQDEIALYAKRIGGEGGKINLDPERIDQPLAAAIALVQKATGKTFNYKTGAFEAPKAALGGSTMIGGRSLDELAKVNPGMADALRAAGAESGQLGEKTVFTFRDVRKLRSYLGQMANKIPEAERRSAAASLNGLSDALKERQYRVLDAEDAARGLTGPRSLRFQWDAGNTLYKGASDLREGFQSRGWIEALDRKGVGSRVIKEIWPDDADIGRVSALKTLMGGDSSPYWNTLRRFKVEEMLGAHAKNPDYLLRTLTSPTVHSADYWRETLGEDSYKRLVDFAKLGKFMGLKNPGKNRILGSMVDAGMVMQGMDMPTALATGAMSPTKAARGLARPVSWLVSTKKIAEWLTNPKQSSMFMSLLNGTPIKRKAGVAWFRNEVARAIADASMTEDPVIKPIPFSATRDSFAPTTGRSAANGIRG